MPVEGADLYKCTDESGTVTYSQFICGTGEEKDFKANESAGTSPTNDPAMIERCVNALDDFLIDPESARISGFGKMKVKLIDYADAPIMVYRVPVYVNAKNSFGGYTGTKTISCYLSRNNKRVLKMESEE